MRKEIRFAGYGGQGIGLMAVLLGKAIAIHEKREAVFTQSYGPESRGGASSADIVADDCPIDFPLVTKPDFLVVLFQEAYQRYRGLLVKDGVLFVDQDLVKPEARDKNFFSVPAAKIAEGLGKTMVANVVMLGFFAAISGAARLESIEEAIKGTVKPKFVDLNIKAFREGAGRAMENPVAKKLKVPAPAALRIKEPFRPQPLPGEPEREGVWGQ